MSMKTAETINRVRSRSVDERIAEEDEEAWHKAATAPAKKTALTDEALQAVHSKQLEVDQPGRDVRDSRRRPDLARSPST